MKLAEPIQTDEPSRMMYLLCMRDEPAIALVFTFVLRGKCCCTNSFVPGGAGSFATPPLPVAFVVACSV